MIVNKANTYVWDVRSQMLILWSAGMDEERISDKVGFSISQHPDYAMLPPRNPGKQSLHLVSRGGAA